MKRLLAFTSPAKDFWFGWLVAMVLVLLIMPMLAHAQVGYIDASSGFLKENTFHASAAETAAGTSTVIDVGAYASGQITVNLTAITGGTTTLDATVYTCQTSTYAAATCKSVATMTQLTGVGSQLISVSGFQRYLAVGWSPGAGTTATFTIYGAFKPYPLTATSPVTTNQGTAAGTSGGWPVKVTDGTTVDTVKAASTAPATTDTAIVVTQRPEVATDPCGSTQVAKSSATYAVSTATTTKVVEFSGTTKVYVCAFGVVNHTAAAGGVTFLYGTQTTTACDTGATNLTGAMDLPSTIGGSLIVGTGNTVFSGASAKALCITNTGTSGLNGWVTYVQQ